jgi:hypothetical protein
MRWLIAPALLAAFAALTFAQPAEPPIPPSTSGAPGLYPPSLARQYKELIPGLMDALKDTDPEVRQHTAMALAALGQEAIAPLVKALDDPVKEKRASAAYALGQMGHNAQEAIPALLKTLKDDEATVRRSASQAISRVLSGEMFVAGRGLPGMRGFVPGAAPGGPAFGGGYGAPPTLPPVDRVVPGSVSPPAPPAPDTKPAKPESPKTPDKPDKP